MHHSPSVMVFSGSQSSTAFCELCDRSSRSRSSNLSWSSRERPASASASGATTTTTTGSGFRNAAAAVAAVLRLCHPGEEICGSLGRWAGVKRRRRRKRRRSSTFTGCCVELSYSVSISSNFSAKPHSTSSSSPSSPLLVPDSSPSCSSSFWSGLGGGEVQLERRRLRPRPLCCSSRALECCQHSVTRAAAASCPPDPNPSPSRVVVVRVSTSPTPGAQTETEAETETNSRYAAAAAAAANYGSEVSVSVMGGGGLGEKAKEGKAKDEEGENGEEGEEKDGLGRRHHHQQHHEAARARARAMQLHVPPDLRAELMPRHVAIIMDGNARWAERRGLHRSVGHAAGAEALKEVARAASNWGIDALTVFAFSTENWRRPQAEVDYLMRMFETKLRKEMGSYIMRHKFRLRFIGDTSSLPQSLQKAGKEAVDITRGNTGMIINLCVSYSGRADLVQACQKLAVEVAEGTLDPAHIDEAAIAEKLSLNELGGLKYPDLLIRTSGEQRISNFLLWQLAYSELVFSDTLWPDFGREEFRAALVAYQRRDRRYGIRKD